MSSRRKPDVTPVSQAILGDEPAAELRADVDALRLLVSDLGRQVHAQFTTISAHAEIARQQAEFAREESRSDLDRTRTLVVELVERTRRELLSNDSRNSVARPTSGSTNAAEQRIDDLESRLADVVADLNRCLERQRVLAETVEALFDAVLSGQRNEPVVGLSLV